MDADSVTPTGIVNRRSAKCGLDPDRIVAARKKLDAMGMTIKDWCDANGYAANYHHVRSILSGRKRCYSGLSHDIAVKLNLKEGVVSDA